MRPIVTEPAVTTRTARRGWRRLLVAGLVAGLTFTPFGAHLGTWIAD